MNSADMAVWGAELQRLMAGAQAAGRTLDQAFKLGSISDGKVQDAIAKIDTGLRQVGGTATAAGAKLDILKGLLTQMLNSG